MQDNFNAGDINTQQTQKALQFLKNAFLSVQNAAGALLRSAEKKGAFLTTVTFMGGGFGFDQSNYKGSPVYGGLAGLAKTADIEWEKVLCHALDMPFDKKQCISNAEAAAALMMTHGAVEIGIYEESCHIPFLVDQAGSSESYENTTEPILTPEDVVVITGGAKGVTANCAIALAQSFSPTLVLLGRSAKPGEEPEFAKGLEDPAALKKAILDHLSPQKKVKPADIEALFREISSNREIIRNIAQMEAAGSKVLYFAADVASEKQIKDVFEEIKSACGPVTGIVHGAGVLEDKWIVDKTIDQYKKVINTKIKGLQALLYAADIQYLKQLILFSSVAARSGNQGQSDYAMANEILNKTAWQISRQYPQLNCLALNWGPWEGGMVTPSLKKEFHKRGIDLIPLASGAHQMIRQMQIKGSGDREIVIGAHLQNPGKPKVRMSRAMTLNISHRAVPALNSHVINNQPVVPFALLMEIHAHAAQVSSPGLVFAGMDDMRLLKGIRPQGDPCSIQVNMGKGSPAEDGFRVASSITSEKTDQMDFHHTGCTVVLKDALPSPPVLSKAAFMELEPCDLSVEQAYQKILFHGKDFHGIRSINGISEKGIEVVSRLAPEPAQWFTSPMSAEWVIDPLMLDSAFQAAILWSSIQHEEVCLPGFIGSFRLYSSFENITGDIKILFTVNEMSRNKISGYFTFLDETGTVVASITGFEAIKDASLKEKFKNTPLYSRESILAFAEGNPSEAFGDRYKPFDKERAIARLPRPPYFFMDRVISADHPKWEMQPGGWIQAQYEVPENAWYFNANRSDTMPYAVLLEIALQPCGWLAAYAGSALQSDDRLYFRNLGGKGTIHAPVTRNSRTLTMKSRMTEVAKAGDMIIQDFEFEVLESGKPVYTGKTNFGFFTAHALSNQVGIRNSKIAAFQPQPSDLENTGPSSFKNDAPLTPVDSNSSDNTGMPSKALRMVDTIDALSFNTGLYENGYIKGTKQVDPDEWYFKAHFYQDPVCPGSLGVESFLQLLRYFLIKKFNISPGQYQVKTTGNLENEWTYRGQIIPENKTIEIHAHIIKAESRGNDYTIIADGCLVVDGICIYEMKSFGVELGYETSKEKKAVS